MEHFADVRLGKLEMLAKLVSIHDVFFSTYWIIVVFSPYIQVYRSYMKTELTKIKDAHLGKVQQFCEKYANQYKIHGEFSSGYC